MGVRARCAEVLEWRRRYCITGSLRRSKAAEDLARRVERFRQPMRILELTRVTDGKALQHTGRDREGRTFRVTKKCK